VISGQQAPLALPPPLPLLEPLLLLKLLAPPVFVGPPLHPQPQPGPVCASSEGRRRVLLQISDMVLLRQGSFGIRILEMRFTSQISTYK
jgi:hypothetical protein